MAKNITYDTTLEENIASLLRTNLGTAYFKHYIVARMDSESITPSSMPCVLISRLDSAGKAQSTASDTNSYNIALTVILSRKAGFLGVKGEEANTLLFNNLVDGIDPVTKEYSPQSIIGILRKNFSIGSSIDNQIHRVNYPIAKMRDTVPTMEAIIKLTVDKHVVVTGRV